VARERVWLGEIAALDESLKHLRQRAAAVSDRGRGRWLEFNVFLVGEGHEVFADEGQPLDLGLQAGEAVCWKVPRTPCLAVYR
jgi:hypothetical protein